MAKNNSSFSDDDIKKFLSQKVKESGFSLENRVAEILRKDYGVKREIPYYDMDEQKGRSYDIKASRLFPDDSNFEEKEFHSIAQYNLLIECKNILGNIWVFSTDTPPGLSLPVHSSLNQDKKPDPVYNVTPYEEIPNIPYVSGYDEYILDKKKSNKKDTNLFSAIMTITKAVRHEKTSLDEMFKKMPALKLTKQAYLLHIAFFQPVIVFTGKIYLSKFNDKRELEFSEEKFVQIQRRYESKDYDETLGEIHIVSFEHLEEYLKMVDQYYRQKENSMIKGKKAFLECAKLAGLDWIRSRQRS